MGWKCTPNGGDTPLLLEGLSPNFYWVKHNTEYTSCHIDTSAALPWPSHCCALTKQQLPQGAGPHGLNAPDYLHTCWFLCWLCCIKDFCIPAITWFWVSEDAATPRGYCTHGYNTFKYRLLEWGDSYSQRLISAGINLCIFRVKRSASHSGCKQ